MHSYKTTGGGGQSWSSSLIPTKSHIDKQCTSIWLLFAVFHAEIHVYFVRKSTKSPDIIAVLTTQHHVLDYPSEYRYNNDGPMKNLATN